MRRPMMCPCCADCGENLVYQIVICPICGFHCQCPGCVADAEPLPDSLSNLERPDA